MRNIPSSLVLIEEQTCIILSLIVITYNKNLDLKCTHVPH